MARPAGVSDNPSNINGEHWQPWIKEVARQLGREIQKGKEFIRVWEQWRRGNTPGWCAYVLSDGK